MRNKCLTWYSMILSVALVGCNQAATKVQEAGKTAADAATDAAASAADTLGASFSAAADKASSALKDVAGGPELLNDVKDLFGSAQKSLQGITDTESAKAAIPSLDELIGKAGGLQELTDKLPAEAKTAINGMIESGIGPIKELIDKVLAIPGVQEIVKPKLDEFLAKVTALTAKA